MYSFNREMKTEIHVWFCSEKSTFKITHIHCSEKRAKTFPLWSDATTCELVKNERHIVYLLKSTDRRCTEIIGQCPAAGQHFYQPPEVCKDIYHNSTMVCILSTKKVLNEIKNTTCTQTHFSPFIRNTSETW